MNTNETETVVETVRVENRGRKKIETNKRALSELVESVKNGEAKLTHFMRKRLVGMGLIEETVVVSDEPRGRGRPKFTLVLTPAGRNLINGLRLTRMNEARKAAKATEQVAA
jgi:hypothetical protein